MDGTARPLRGGVAAHGRAAGGGGGRKKATERGAEYDTIALIDELRVCLTASEVEKAEGDNLGTGMEVVSETETETVKVV